MEYNIPIPKELLSRYARHLILPEFKGFEGFEKISNSSIVIVGAGGLGCPVSLYLASAGVGNIKIIDDDVVELSNLTRQCAYTTDDINSSKAEILRDRLLKINPTINVEVIIDRLNYNNSLEYFSCANIILDCTDNMETRYCISDSAVKLGIPVVSASCIKWDGQLTIYNYNNGPCYRCLFPTPPTISLNSGTCVDNGVVGAVPGLMGSLQAIETLKLILGCASLSENLLIFNALHMSINVVKIRSKLKDCLACSPEAIRSKYFIVPKFQKPCFMYESSSANISNVVMLNSDSNYQNMSVEHLRDVFYNSSKSILKEYLLIDVREAFEYSILGFKIAKNIPFSIIKNHDWKPVFYCLKEHFENIKIEHNGTKIPSFKIVFICKRGNLSKMSLDHLSITKTNYPDIENFANENKINFQMFNLLGGLDGWSSIVDPHFPIY